MRLDWPTRKTGGSNGTITLFLLKGHTVLKRVWSSYHR